MLYNYFVIYAIYERQQYDDLGNYLNNAKKNKYLTKPMTSLLNFYTELDAKY